MKPLPLSRTDVAILVGGMGTRLRGVVDGIPKPLAPVLGRPFLFYILDRLALRGARSVVLCCGYRADAVREAVGTEWLGMPVRISIESDPLGTGGALRNAASLMESERIVAMNGDSWFEPDWTGLLNTDPGIPTWIASVDVPDSSRYGTLEILNNRVMAFREKSLDPGPGPINAGIYLIDHSWLETLPAGPFSLEREVFPDLAASLRLGAFPGSGPFLDIGVPQDYQAAGRFLEQIGVAPHSMFPDGPKQLEAMIKLGACVIVRDPLGRILMDKRSDCGWWGLPGGKMEPGETLEQCALRETFEETGLKVDLRRFIGIFSNPIRRTVRYPDNGDLRQLVDAAWMAEPVGGVIKKSPESLEIDWFNSEDIPLNTVPPVVEILRKGQP